MSTVTTGTEVLRREWRALLRLVLEGCAAGIFVSLVLALAVFVASTRAEAAGLDARLTCDHEPSVAHSGTIDVADHQLAISVPVILTLAKTSAAPMVGVMVLIGAASLIVTRYRRRAVVSHPMPVDVLGRLERATRASRLVC